MMLGKKKVWQDDRISWLDGLKSLVGLLDMYALHIIMKIIIKTQKNRKNSNSNFFKCKQFASRLGSNYSTKRKISRLGHQEPKISKTPQQYIVRTINTPRSIELNELYLCCFGFFDTASDAFKIIKKLEKTSILR